MVAETPSYQSSIYIHNPSLQTVNVVFNYTGATGSATPGVTVCPAMEIAPGAVIRTSLPSLCPALSGGSNFGVLAQSTNINCCYSIAVYTRAQTQGGNGFSIEGMTDSGYYCCSAIVREVIGLTRQAAAPTFQSNCFVWNQDPVRAGRIVVTLLTGNGLVIVDDILNLQPGEFVRILDVFAAFGAPPGDYSNARATFESIVPGSGGNPVNFTASCTVQNNTSFDADFRIAKWHN